MKIPYWINVNYNTTPPVFECTRCKATRELHFPAPINDVEKQSEAFCVYHKYCKERRGDEKQ